MRSTVRVQTWHGASHIHPNDIQKLTGAYTPHTANDRSRRLSGLPDRTRRCFCTSDKLFPARSFGLNLPSRHLHHLKLHTNPRNQVETSKKHATTSITSVPASKRSVHSGRPQPTRCPSLARRLCYVCGSSNLGMKPMYVCGGTRTYVPLSLHQAKVLHVARTCKRAERI